MSEKKKKGPQTKLSKTWCREPPKLWQIQQVGLPQKARFSNLGTCTDNFSRRTDVNQHTLTCANQPISLKCAIANSACHVYMQHTSDETCPCDTAGGWDICHHCPPLSKHTQKRAHTHTHTRTHTLLWGRWQWAWVGLTTGFVPCSWSQTEETLLHYTFN